MPVGRDIDWVKYLNLLVFCYGCGRFGIPTKRGIPRGWKVLYQPHADAPPGLHVCGRACAESVREAMTKGPVHEPLKMGAAPPMPEEMKAAMFREVIEETIEEALRPYADDENFTHKSAVEVATEALMKVPGVRDVALRIVGNKPVLDIMEDRPCEYITIKITQDIDEEEND